MVHNVKNANMWQQTGVRMDLVKFLVTKTVSWKLATTNFGITFNGFNY